MSIPYQSQDTSLGICSGVEWLLTHHRAKKEERQQMVTDIQIKPGEAILDVGCGPGLWSQMFAEYVQPHGRVVGIDGLAESIVHAKEAIKSESSQKCIEFLQADFYSLPFDASSFDITFCGNCLSYVQEPIEFIAEQKRVTKKGGRIVSKEYDAAVLMLHPVDPVLLSKVLHAAECALAELSPEQKFDNAPGRKVWGWFQQVGFQDTLMRTYAIQKHAPLSPEVEFYLRSAIEWYGRKAEPYLSQDEMRRWQQYTDPSNSQYILDRDDFYYCSFDIMTIGKV